MFFSPKTFRKKLKKQDIDKMVSLEALKLAKLLHSRP